LCGPGGLAVVRLGLRLEVALSALPRALRKLAPLPRTSTGQRMEQSGWRPDMLRARRKRLREVVCELRVSRSDWPPPLPARSDPNQPSSGRKQRLFLSWLVEDSGPMRSAERVAFGEQPVAPDDQLGPTNLHSDEKF
jgi:hypothetical protein